MGNEEKKQQTKNNKSCARSKKKPAPITISYRFDLKKKINETNNKKINPSKKVQ